MVFLFNFVSVKAVILHEKYFPNKKGKRSKTNDIALLKLTKSVKFNYNFNTEGSILPICWSHKVESLEDDTVYVSGWGHTYDQYCNTNKGGPSPYQRCQKKFVYKGETYFGCTSMRSPSSNDETCRKLYDHVEDHAKGLYEKAFRMYDTIRVRTMTAGYSQTETDCYSFNSNPYGWCATCNPDVTEPGESGYCRILESGKMFSRYFLSRQKGLI